MKQFAYSTITIKAASESTNGRRTFRGVASTPSADRMGDVVEPKGAVFKLPLPLLWQHDSHDPIGWITSAKVTTKGIDVEGEVADIPDAGPLKDRLLTAWQMLKSGLVRGLSIGFNVLEYSRIDGGNGLRFLSWEWLELSAVTIAANQEASITSIKSADRLILAAMGRKDVTGGGDPPGASGTSNQPSASRLSHSRSQKGTKTMKTKSELLEARAQKQARMQELTEAPRSEGGRMSDADGEEFDSLDSEIKSIDNDLRVLRAAEVAAGTARGVDGTSSAAATASRTGGRGMSFVKSQDPDDAFPGQSFTRMVIAKALAFKNQTTPSRVAEARWGKSNPKLVQVIRANEVPGGGTEPGEWGSQLVDYQRYTGDFVEFLRGLTVFDRLPLRSVPANVAIKGMDGAATAYWVGQSKAIPVTALDFADPVNLAPLKVAAIAVLSNELLADSTPSAEMIVRDELGAASAERIDRTFLSTDAGIPGVAPAGILNGVMPLASSGTDAAAVRADVATLLGSFLAAKNVGGLTFVTNAVLALQLQLLRNALGQREFADVALTGGRVEGLGLVTGDNVGAGDVILLKPSDIWKIGDSGVDIAVSSQATIEQSTVPTGATDTPVAASQAITSMFQEDSTAIRVIRRINFAKRRAGAVAWIDAANYTG